MPEVRQPGCKIQDKIRFLYLHNLRYCVLGIWRYNRYAIKEVNNMKYYKLTDENSRTKNDTLWGEGLTHKVGSNGCKLCTADVIHVYDHPLKAVIFNPIHANFSNPILWECKVKRILANDGTKVGVKECTTVSKVELPVITTNQLIRFAIYCALEVYQSDDFKQWSDNWLSGKDRSAEAAARAAEAAAWAAEAAELDIIKIIHEVVNK